MHSHSVHVRFQPLRTLEDVIEPGMGVILIDDFNEIFYGKLMVLLGEAFLLATVELLLPLPDVRGPTLRC